MDADVDPVRKQADELRRERDALAARVAALESPGARRRRARRGMVAVLLVIGVAAASASAAGWWARRNLADTDRWVERVGPLAEDPAVREALGRWLTTEVVAAVDPATRFAEALPDEARLLAGPLASAVEDFVRSRIDRFLASDRFARLWVEANEQAHRAVIRVLRDESEAVQAQSDRVVINLVPVVNAVLADVGSASPELLGRTVDLPELQVDDLPEDAIARLERALDIQLDDNIGQFTVYDHGRLTALQDGLERARRWLYVLSVTAAVALPVALWISDRRRRTLLQILAGLAFGLALIRRLGLRGQRELLAAIPDATNRAAAEAVSNSFLEPLLAVTRTLLIVLALGAVVAVLTGPYPWVVRLRRGIADTVRGFDPDWLGAHRRELSAVGLAVVLLLLLVADLSFAFMAGLVALAALGGALLWRDQRESQGRAQAG